MDEIGQTSVENKLLDEEIASWNSHHSGNPKTGEQLTEMQQSNLKKLLKEFAYVLQDKPGRAITVQHTFNTETASPVYLLPY